MTSQYKQKILEKIKSLAPLPVSTQKIAAMVDDPTTEVRDLSRVIEKDAILAGRLLRVSNSSFYGFPGTIATISRAVTIIGFNGVKSLALGLAIVGDIKKNKTNTSVTHSLENLWRHALAVATAARHIAVHRGYPVPEEAFVSGLLHDIGKVILLENFFEDYDKIIQTSKKGSTTLNRRETETFGISHTEIGAALCQHWNIPEKLSQAVAEHHLPPDQETNKTGDGGLVFAVKIGDTLAKIAQIGCDGDPTIPGNFFEGIQDTRIQNVHLHQILLNLPKEVADAEQFFNISRSGENEQNRIKRSKNLVCLLFEEAAYTKLVHWLLISLGYCLLTKEKLEENSSNVAGVIYNKALDLPLQNRLKKQNIPSIDFSDWQPEEGRSNAPINMPRLSEWLCEKLNTGTEVLR